jgi:hypothetical protein
MGVLCVAAFFFGIRSIWMVLVGVAIVAVVLALRFGRNDVSR